MHWSGERSGVDSGGGCGAAGTWAIAVLPALFCCEPKTGLKNKVYFFLKPITGQAKHTYRSDKEGPSVISIMHSFVQQPDCKLHEGGSPACAWQCPQKWPHALSSNSG